MSAILRKLPFFEHATDVFVRGERLRVKRDQIIVWISITGKGRDIFDPHSARFPAILDTGCNHSLVIRRDHLAVWASRDPGRIRFLRSTRVHGRPAAELAANLWLHRNVPRHRDVIASKGPTLLEAPQGIVVTNGLDDDFPRLPLLGLRVIRQAGLHVHINGRRRTVTIRTDRWLGLFG